MFLIISIATYAAHDCIGQECKVCAMFTSIKSIIEHISRAISLALFAGLFIVISVVMMILSNVESFTNTPFSIKVKLNN